MSYMDLNTLRILQALPYELKVAKTKLRVKEWYEYHEGNVAVSFSGGLDSTVLLHLAREEFPNMLAVSIPNIECSANRSFISTISNVVEIKPRKSQTQVIKEYGYPVVSKKVARMISTLQNPTERNEKSRNLYLTGIKSNGETQPRWKLPKKWYKLIEGPFKISNKCCYYMKEEPLSRYAKENNITYFVATLAEESEIRTQAYIAKGGCNTFKKGANSTPLGFWNHQDVLRYIAENKLAYSAAYGDILQDETGNFYTTKAKRTGCDICAFGVHLESKPNRFQRMYDDDPKMWNFAINTLGFGEVLDFIEVPYKPY